MIRKIFVGLVLYAVFSFQLIASEDRALFWRVDSADATVYLLGSIHFADDSFYPLRAEIEHAFDTADSLVVEVDMSAPEVAVQFQNMVQHQGRYQGDETLKDHLSEKTYQQLQAYLKELGISPTLLEKQKPGIVVLILAGVQAQQAGLNAEQGIDLHFLNRAKNHKQVLALESVEEQLKLFLDFEDADALFQDLFHSQEVLESEMNELISIWKQGDEKVMYQLLFDDVLKENAAMAALYERLYFQRNIKMVKSIESYLAQQGRYFVVVGAGHLIGDKGIVQLLQQAGYRTTRL